MNVISRVRILHAESKDEDLEINLNGRGTGEFYKALEVKKNVPKVIEIAHGF